MNQERLDKLSAAVKERRKKSSERLRRQIEMGYVKGKILPNGAVYQTKPKGIQHWYDTATLVRLVTESFDRNEGICRINGKWQLQIRGKHLRRLLKAMPNVKQIGRMLVRSQDD